MISKFGIVSLVLGLALGVFSGISRFLGMKNKWADGTLSGLLGEEKTEGLITWFDAAFIQNSLDILFYETPFFILAGAVGIIALVTSLFVREH
mgnify:CR=1 FL=1